MLSRTFASGASLLRNVLPPPLLLHVIPPPVVLLRLLLAGERPFPLQRFEPAGAEPDDLTTFASLHLYHVRVLQAGQVAPPQVPRALYPQRVRQFPQPHLSAGTLQRVYYRLVCLAKPVSPPQPRGGERGDRAQSVITRRVSSSRAATSFR